MASRSFVALLALVVALVAVPAAGPGGAVSGAPVDNATGSVQAATTTAGASPSGVTATATAVNRSTLPPSDVTWRAQLRANGDARWTVSMTVPIRDVHDAAAFDDLAASFDSVENPLALDFFRTAAEAAGAETGREMAITDVSRAAGRANGSGTLAVSFRWSSFARVEGDRLYVGDGFNTTRGTWLPELTEYQTLVVVPPSGYGVTSAPSVGITGGAARWEGPYNLSGREPWVVYSGNTPTPTDTPTTPGATTAPGTGTPGTETPDGLLGSLLPVVGLAVLAGVAAAALVVYMRREDGGIGGIGGTTDDGDGGTGTTTGEAGVANDAGADSAADAAGTGAAASGTAAGAVDEATDDSGDEVDEELLSDEERVERLLERNGGRMKQATIVKETGWSNAKVSQLLSSMAAEGRVDKLRIGRENLISFPDEDVTDIDSPE